MGAHPSADVRTDPDTRVRCVYQAPSGHSRPHVIRVTAQGRYVVLTLSSNTAMWLGLQSVDQFHHLLLRQGRSGPDDVVRCAVVRATGPGTTTTRCEIDVQRGDGGVVLALSMGGEFRLDSQGEHALRVGLTQAGNQAAYADANDPPAAPVGQEED